MEVDPEAWVCQCAAKRKDLLRLGPDCGRALSTHPPTLTSKPISLSPDHAFMNEACLYSHLVRKD